MGKTNSGDGGGGDGGMAALLEYHRSVTGQGIGRDELFRVVSDSLFEGVTITDLEDRILFVNAAFAELTGYSREELIGATAYKVLCPPELWPEMQRRNRSRGRGEVEEYELEQFRKDGSRQWVSIRATPYRNGGGGEIIGTVGAVTCLEAQKGLELQNAYLREEIQAEFNECDLVGESPAILKVMEQVKLVAPTDATVLILGESGTGKELVARAIHQLSGRKEKPLVRVNCASIPRELFESEFFGHVKGAFTGAVRDRVGRFELAHGGTLFLDEVGEIPPDLQGKLLRVLQEGEFERVGEERTRKVDVRLIAATNRDLLEEIGKGEGRFRSDLYYRLSVFDIALPALRKRAGDIPLLARHFIARSADRLKLAPPRVAPRDVEQLKAYPWPGNVRELQNVIERAVIVSRGGRLQLELGKGGVTSVPDAPEPGRAGELFSARGMGLADLDRLEREILTGALKDCRWKIYGEDGAAALLGIKPTTLATKMKRFGLRKPARSTALEIGVDD